MMLWFRLLVGWLPGRFTVESLEDQGMVYYRATWKWRNSNFSFSSASRANAVRVVRAYARGIAIYMRAQK